MGQFLNKETEARVVFDENGDNGLSFGNGYLPEELLTEILCYLDPKTLLKCQCVCKRWNVMIGTYVWRKKAETILKRPLPSVRNMPWSVYYTICHKRPFQRNLLKNHSGKDGVKKHWNILSEGGDRWKVECPPLGVPPLPITEPVFEGKQNCFATSYYSCSKEQTIDLVAEGLNSHLLDRLTPSITVSEWYSCRWDCPAVYECSARLLDECDRVLDTFQFRDTIEGDRQNQWLFISHKFENYKPCVRKVSFYHGGMDKLFWAGHYGAKMAGACVWVDLPQVGSSEIRIDPFIDQE